LIIRCERCSTTYELDEKLLATGGSEVQCTKCQHVFLAHPPRAPGRTLAGMAAQAEPAAARSHEPALAAPAAPAPARAAAPPSPTTAPAASQRPEGSPRPVRTTAPQVYRPQSGASAGGAGAGVHRAPVLKRDTVGTFEARLRWSARWRWLAPTLLVLGIAAVVGAWTLLARRGDSGAERTSDEALSLVALDDAGSVDDGSARLAALVMKRPKLRAPAADRALALAVRAAGLGEEVEGLNARMAQVREERERARRDQGPGWEAIDRARSTEATQLEGEIRSREDRFRALASGAREQLVVLQAEAGETREVLRAYAVLHALSGERDKLHRIVRAVKETGGREPWIELADGWSDARDPDRAARERALVKLGALAAARPDLLRGRYLLARAQLSLGRRTEAVATLEGVLSANARHERAKRLHDDLSAPPPPEPPAALPPVAPVPPVVGKPMARMRKFAAQPSPDDSVSSGSEPSPRAPAPAPGQGASPAASTASGPGPQHQPAAAPAAPEPAAAPPSPAEPAETRPPPPRRRRLIEPVEEPVGTGG